MSAACFKAYDIRGRIGDKLNEDMAWRIGRAMADWLKASRIVVGADMRLSSPALSNALCEGIMSSGGDVIDIGLSSTEEVYFGTVYHQADGVSLEFSDWRFNVRASNTEPLIRLNVETRSNPELLASKTRELSTLLRSA